MESVSAEFPELENIPSSQISLTEASRLQSSAVSNLVLITAVHVEEQELLVVLAAIFQEIVLTMVYERNKKIINYT